MVTKYPPSIARDIWQYRDIFPIGQVTCSTPIVLLHSDFLVMLPDALSTSKPQTAIKMAKVKRFY